MAQFIMLKTRKKLLGNTLLSVSFVALMAPQFAAAQAASPIAAEEARAAELMCQVAGVCGDLAEIENARIKETQDGKSVRAMMSIGAVKPAIAGSSSVESPAVAEGNIIRESIPRAVEQGVWQEATTVRSSSIGKYIDTPATPEFRGQLMVNFALGSDELTDDSMFDIRSFALAVKTLDSQGVYKRFRIEGHADSSGSEAINQPLSARRAKAVRDMLLTTGLDEGRIEFAGYGSEVPLPGLSPDSSLNRRVEAVLIE